MTPWSFVSPDAEATRAIGRELGRAIGADGLVLALVGPLGAGKTVFVKGLAEGLGVEPRAVSSPTFVIAQQYAVPEAEAASVTSSAVSPTPMRSSAQTPAVSTADQQRHVEPEADRRRVELAPALAQAAPGRQPHVEQEQAEHALERRHEERRDRLGSGLSGDPADDQSADQHHDRCVQQHLADQFPRLGPCHRLVDPAAASGQHQGTDDGRRLHQAATATRCPELSRPARRTASVAATKVTMEMEP